MEKVLLTLVLGLFFVTFSNAQSKNSPKAKSEITLKASKSVEYQCPMDCEKGKTYDKEGSCPVCKMDLKVKGSAKAKGCCAGSKTKASCGDSKKASSCAGEKKASSCAGEKKSECKGKKGSKSSCPSKK